MSQAKIAEPARIRAPLTSFIALALASSLGACGGGSHPATTEPDDGGAGEASTTHPGSGGRGNGGQGGQSGHGGADAGMGSTKDDVPPTFNGISMIAKLGEGSVRVSWDPAMDNVTSQGAMGYRVYRASKAGAEDFTRARRCGDYVPDATTVEQSDAPCYVTAVAGATSAVVNDALPSQPFFYVARAVDAAGNEDKNTNEASAQTDDKTAPVFGGVDSITAVTASTVQVTWGAAFDSTSPDPTLTYDVFLKQDAVPDPDKDKPAFTSKPGAHTALIAKLSPLTTYHTIVRAVDAAGNVDTNTYSLAVTTPEGIAPTFDGIKTANSVGNTVRLFWYPGSDNFTHPENIVYDVYSSLIQHREDFTKPPRATSAPGVASITIDEANAATRYYYVVRARDVAGNTDANNVEKFVVTGPLPDDTPPTFNGAQTVVASGPSSLKVTWAGAADDRTTEPDGSGFTYQVYVSTSSTVSLKTPAVTVRGSLSTTVLGLNPATTYNVVVLAFDEAGNASNALAATSAATGAAVAGDTTPPVLGRAPTAVAAIKTPTRQLDVTWTAATDDVSAAADIRYHVCASVVKSDCTGTNFFAHVAVTTAPGVTSVTVPFLDPRTTYNVFVRAEDAAGNLSTDEQTTQGITNTSWATNAQPILLNHCVSCHNYNEAVAIINVLTGFTQSNGEEQTCTDIPKMYAGCPLPLIYPKEPKWSMIYRRVNPLGLTTPPFNSKTTNAYSGALEPRDTVEKLSAEEDGILLDWITQGALTD
ncbi:MAG TPA: hypothetical protein VH062_19780 [Polyangiaceae bacterium]|nr:hypothetical protein [Polyangiaceae bacterium]